MNHRTTPKTESWTKLAVFFLMAILAALWLSGCGDVDAQTSRDEIAALLAAKDTELAAKEAELAQQEAELAEREASLAENGRRIAEGLEGLEERQGELEKVASGLEQRATGVERRASQLKTKETELEESEALLAEAQNTLAETRTAVEREAERQREVARKNPPEVYAEIDLPAATTLDVEFLTTVSSATSRPGDTFATRVTKDLLAADGRLVVPAGTELIGVVTEAQSVKRVGGQSLLGLRFGELHLPWGKSVEINASFQDVGRDESRRDKKIIGGAAAGGAVLGAILDDDDRGRGTILGAIIGAAAGTAAAANKPADQVEIPGGAGVTLQLDEPAKVMVPWKSRYAEPAVAPAD